MCLKSLATPMLSGGAPAPISGERLCLNIHFCLFEMTIPIGTFLISWPALSKQLQVLSPEYSGGMPLAEYPFSLQYSLHRWPSVLAPIFPTCNWWKIINIIGSVVTQTDSRIWFLFKPGFTSSFLPVTNPMEIEMTHSTRKVRTNKAESIFSVIWGQGLSP